MKFKTNDCTNTSFPKKQESGCVAVATPMSLCRIDALCWIPAFAGMTMEREITTSMSGFTA